MPNPLIIEMAIEEVEAQTLGATEQFLNVHKVAYADNKPRIARVDTDKEDEAIVYFHVEDQKFYFAVYVDLKPEISVRWTDTEPYHSVYFRASSDNLTLKDLAQMTTLTSTRGRNKGDRRNPDGGTVVWNRSTIDFEPNPEADEFEDKLTKLLDYLEQDMAGVKNLVNAAGGYIQVYSSFHNGNTLLGGHYITKEHIKRMSRLKLEIDFDISADGNLFS